MDVDDLARYYPRLYHMAEDGAWDSIRRQGLMSTASLVELFQIPEPQRSRLLTQHRPESVTLTHPLHGTVVIRDQKPLHLAKLEQLLIDMTVSEWIELVNSFVFFWLHPHRVSTLLNARAYRDRSHLVLTLDTQGIIRAYMSQIRLAHLNTGATPYYRGPRGSSTFKSIADFPHPRPRSLDKPPRRAVELAIPGAVPDVLEHTLRVERRQDGMVLDTLFARP
jgi:hypothetical protein